MPAESLNGAFLERMVTLAIVAFDALLLFLGALFIEVVTTASEADNGVTQVIRLVTWLVGAGGSIMSTPSMAFFNLHSRAPG